MLATEVISSDWIKDLISAGTDLLEVLTNIVKQDDLISGTIGIITDGINGTMKVKDGFLQIGEAEKQIFNNETSSGFGKQVLLLVS